MSEKQSDAAKKRWARPGAKAKQRLRAKQDWADRRNADPEAGKKRTERARDLRGYHAAVMRALLKSYGVKLNLMVAGYRADFVTQDRVIYANDVGLRPAEWRKRKEALEAAGYEVHGFGGGKTGGSISYFQRPSAR